MLLCLRPAFPVSCSVENVSLPLLDEVTLPLQYVSDLSKYHLDRATADARQKVER